MSEMGPYPIGQLGARGYLFVLSMKNKVSNECYMQEVCTYFDIYAIFKQNARETLFFV